jgi:two-component sensor histidine kinase
MARFPIAADTSPIAILATLGMAVAALAVRMLVAPVLPPGYPFLTFFPAVIVTSVLFGVRAGAVQAVLCGCMAWYFFIPPVYSMALSQGSAVAMSFYVFVVATDIALVHWMQAANRQLAREQAISRALAETRELLFRELQHRVSNNLQVAAALEDTARRLALIGRISRQLYDASGEAHALIPFLDGLCRDVIEAAGRGDVSLAVTGDESVQLVPDSAIPTALVVAEAVANALEHGLADERPGTIAVRVAMDQDAREVEIAIEDDGIGLPADFDVERANSLGLHIARMLAASRGGRFALEHDGRTRATLRLPR